MSQLTAEIIRYYREEIGYSYRKIGKLFGLHFADVWKIENSYEWRKTPKGKQYLKHRNHTDYKVDCEYCSFEKRRDALHSRSL